MTYPRDKAIEVEPGEDKVDQAEEARRTEDDIRANKGIGRTYSRSANRKPRKNSKKTPIAGKSREKPARRAFELASWRPSRSTPPCLARLICPFGRANAVGIKAAWSYRPGAGLSRRRDVFPHNQLAYRARCSRSSSHWCRAG
jgi:hypothetical protein